MVKNRKVGSWDTNPWGKFLWPLLRTPKLPVHCEILWYISLFLLTFAIVSGLCDRSFSSMVSTVLSFSFNHSTASMYFSSALNCYIIWATNKWATFFLAYAAAYHLPFKTCSFDRWKYGVPCFPKCLFYHVCLELI